MKKHIESGKDFWRNPFSGANASHLPPNDTKGGSLYLTILLLTLLTMGVLLLFLAISLTPKVSTLLEQNAIDRTKDTVRQSTSGLEVYVNNMLSTLHFLSGLSPDTPGEDQSAYQARIGLIKQSQQDIKSIAFFAEDGRMLCATESGLTVSSEEVKRAEWFEKALDWQGTVTYFSSPHVQYLFADRHDWVITLSRAVSYEDAGAVKTGVLLVDYDFSAIASLASGIQLGTSGYAYIVDTRDEIIFHPRQHLIYAGIASEGLTAAMEQVVGTTRDVEEGRERILIINTISQTRWRMVGVAYIDEILALQNAFIRIFFIVLLCGGLLSLAGASLTAYYVTRPIHHLQNKMRQVEEGDLNTTIAERGFQEIRMVSRTFNHMLERVRDLMRQIVMEQEAKRLHELNALQAQINPHFLYNTLDSIIWIEEQGRSEEAIEMVSALARLFRISISKGRNIITVREELEHVRNYLIIQKMRFKNKFTHEIVADEEALTHRTVKLILQPLVENAIHHAIDPYGERTLHIQIRAWVDGEFLMLSVSDDGIGIPAEKLAAILTAPAGKSGIGLRNVHERIRLTCGSRYGLTIDSVEDEGTLVIICLPAGLEESV